MDENTASNSTRDLPVRQREIDYQRIFESAPALLLLLGVNETFTILDACDGYLRATYTARDQIVGRSLFEVFPDNPEDQGATGATNLRASLQRVLATGRPDTMVVQRYDVRRPSSGGGGFEERHWSCVNAPVLGPDGRLLFIIHRVEDVTELARTNRALTSEGEALRLEVMARGQELHEANRQLREATEQFQAMYDQGLFAARRVLQSPLAQRRVVPQRLRTQRLVRDARRLVRSAARARGLRPDWLEALRPTDLPGARPSVRAEAGGRRSTRPDWVLEDFVTVHPRCGENRTTP